MAKINYILKIVVNHLLPCMVIWALAVSLASTQRVTKRNETTVSPVADVQLASDTPFFHCARNTLSCRNNGSCDVITGQCSCRNNFTSFDCSVPTSRVISPSQCFLSCENGGTCVQLASRDNTTRHECQCNTNFYGTECEHQRVSHKCSHNGLDIAVLPFTSTNDSFNGAIYISNQEHDDHCVLTSELDTEIYTKFIAYEQCGGAAAQTDADGNVVRSVTVVVQYDTKYLQGTDEEFTLTCVEPRSGGSIQWQSASVTYTKKRKQQREIEQTYLPVDIKVADGAGNGLSAPQQIGKPLTISFTLRTQGRTQAYDSFLVDSVVATNGFEPDHSKRQELKLVDGGCISNEAKPMILSFSGNQSSEVKLNFTLFKLMNSKRLYFESVVRLCRRDSACSLANCTLNTGLRRARRDNHSKGDVTYSHMKTSVLLAPQHGSENEVEEGSRETGSVMQSCLRHPLFLITVGVLALLLIISLIALTVCIVRLTHANTK